MKRCDAMDGIAIRRGMALLLSLTLVAGCSEKKGPEKGEETGSETQTTFSDAEATCTVGDIAIIDMYLSPTHQGATGAVYCTLANRGEEPDSLIGITTPATPDVEIHEMVEERGTRTMRKITGGLPIRGKESVELKPEGAQIMLINVTRPLRDGDTVEIELQFARAGRVKCHGIVGNAPPKSSAGTAGSGAEENQVGAEVYRNYCQTCHQADGKGIDQVFPPLAGSDFLKKKEETIDAIVNGKEGAINVNGKEFNGVMPPLISVYDNEQAAAVINYVVQKFGDGSWSTTAAEVKNIRKE